jgi:hypothetical protein
MGSNPPKKKGKRKPSLYTLHDFNSILVLNGWGEKKKKSFFHVQNLGYWFGNEPIGTNTISERMED